MTDENALAETLHGLDPNVFEAAERDAWRRMMAVDAQARTADAVRHETEAWRQVASVADWQRFRDRRLAALRRSLQPFPPDSLPLSIRVTGELDGDGYRLRKLVYETRPGVLVTAHLYLPDPLPESMPGIQICHAHHRPKDQAELQDMGVNWARTGAAVLVPDMVGYGERGEEPFGGRQNYYVRYYTAMHLHLVGESLIGWMAWDLIRGTDVLLDLPAIDEDRIVMIGAVAGGGDAAGVAAALDPRVACSIPFNFGGGSAWRADLPAPAPEGTNLAGAPYWETTRNLWLSTRDEFFPWLIVAAAAPRFLIYAHEFGWDAEADEAWHRMQKVYELYGASDRLGWMKGAGRCAPGEGNTHCTNVGPVHRGKLYPYLERWLGMEPPLPEVQDRREPDELACLDDAAQARRRPLRETARETADALGARLREQLDGRPPEQKRALLRRKWADLLGDIKPRGPSSGEVRGETDLDGVAVRSLLLEVEPGITVPMRLFLPAAGAPPPVVVAVAHEGKAGFLDGRPGEIAGLLA
ncbi:MAG: acetylxylan esterase, partial [Planctomycetota bacterium]